MDCFETGEMVAASCRKWHRSSRYGVSGLATASAVDLPIEIKPTTCREASAAVLTFPPGEGQEVALPRSPTASACKCFAHLVTQDRDGRNLIYRAAYDQLDALLSFMTANCC